MGSPLQCGNRNVGADLCVCPNAQHRKMSGFTVVELMIVLAIMGIMLVLAVPSFVQFTRNSRIKSGSQMVVSALRTARSYAITKRKNHRVIIDTVMNAVKVYEDDMGTLSDWKVMPKTIVISSDDISKSLDVPYPDDSAAITSSKLMVEFKPTGATTTSYSSVEIQVSDDDKTNPDTSYIEIMRLTGRVRTHR